MQIQMARISQGNSVLGVNVEDPVALVARMRVPTSYDEMVISDCGLQVGASSLADQFAKTIKLNILKGAQSTLELTVTRPNPELAKACANAAYRAIAQSQDEIIDSARDKNSARLAIVNERLAQDKILLARSEQRNGLVPPVYLALLSEIRGLEDERQRLLEASGAKGLQKTLLLSPISVSDRPVHPKKSISLMTGFIGGLILGVLLALVHKLVLNGRV